MKTWILSMVMMAGVTMSAQEGEAAKVHREPHGKPSREMADRLTPEQRTQLKAKNLTLKLDLTDKQQKDVEKLLLAGETKKQELFNKRKAAQQAGTKPAPEDRFAMRGQMLDERIATKREFKKILTAEQYTKFERLQAERIQKAGEPGKRFKKPHRR